MTTLDDLDRALIHALQIDGRVPFTVAAQVLGTSVQTVTRRYNRLRAQAGLRVVAEINPEIEGRQQWLVRLTATPTTARQIATALARRDDTSWVRLASGGTEIIAIVTSATEPPTAHNLLLHDIPRTSGITNVSAHHLLHTYLGGPSAWSGRTVTLSPTQQDQLRPPSGTGSTPDQPTPLSAVDQRIVRALSADGRRKIADLARDTHISPSTITRRLDAMRTNGAIFFDLEMNDATLGITTKTMLWMSITPQNLETTANDLSTHPELAFVAATTGPTNVAAHALTRDLRSLHRYLTDRLGTIDTISNIETAPILATLKANRPHSPTRQRPSHAG